MSERLYQTVGANIRAIREQRGVSQNQAALDLGLFQSHLWRIEIGENLPSVKTLEKICEYLDVTATDILGF